MVSRSKDTELTAGFSGRGSSRRPLTGSGVGRSPGPFYLLVVRRQRISTAGFDGARPKPSSPGILRNKRPGHPRFSWPIAALFRLQTVGVPVCESVIVMFTYPAYTSRTPCILERVNVHKKVAGLSAYPNWSVI